jgi:uncharacterized protein YbjT (DUF2867 family)
MDSRPEHTATPVIAVLGGTGRFGASFIQVFLDEGLRVRILARSPQKVAKRFAQARVVHGSMLHLPDVTSILRGASAAFLITPVGSNDDVRIELEAARIAIAAAKATRLPHLIYLSLIQPTRPTGVPMLDVKGRIEAMALAAGVPFSSLRTGCYMDTWLTFFPRWMKLGLYLFPITSGRRFSFTSQRDVARAAVLLIRQTKVLHGVMDIVDPHPYTMQEVVDFYKAASGRRLTPVGRWLLPVLKLLKPALFRWLYPTGASRVSLFSYFNDNDWVGDPRRLADVLPGLRITSLAAHLKSYPPS